MTIQAKTSMALLMVVLAGATLLGAGCGSSAGGSEWAVEWSVSRPVGPNMIRVSAVIETCSPPKEPLLEPPIIEYDGNRVYIELRRTPEVLEEDQNGCLLSLHSPRKIITLKRDLDELVLFDASTDPPEQRWPADLPWLKK